MRNIALTTTNKIHVICQIHQRWPPTLNELAVAEFLGQGVPLDLEHVRPGLRNDRRRAQRLAARRGGEEPCHDLRRCLFWLGMRCEVEHEKHKSLIHVRPPAQVARPGSWPPGAGERRPPAQRRAARVRGPRRWLARLGPRPLAQAGQPGSRPLGASV